jgi:hypothetical protein
MFVRAQCRVSYIWWLVLVMNVAVCLVWVPTKSQFAMQARQLLCGPWLVPVSHPAKNHHAVYGNDGGRRSRTSRSHFISAMYQAHSNETVRRHGPVVDLARGFASWMDTSCACCYRQYMYPLYPIFSTTSKC